jgi:hypothetical protein
LQTLDDDKLFKIIKKVNYKKEKDLQKLAIQEEKLKKDKIKKFQTTVRSAVRNEFKFG